MNTLPSGTVTFIFTAIEDSAGLWDRDPEAGQQLTNHHHAVVGRQVAAAGGVVVKFLADGSLAVFSQAPDALAAALAIQRECGSQEHRVAMAIHTGAAQERDHDYFGPTLNRGARLLAVGYGGQILLSQAALAHAGDWLPPGASLRDLGERSLKDLASPERIFQLVHPDLINDFPPLRTLDSRPANLPTQSTALIGRERELSETGALLRRPDVRILSLTGPGGIGKTRLGLQIAAEALDDFDHGVTYAPLEAITQPGLLPSAIASALGVREIVGEPLLETIKEQLRPRQQLLLLDNFEQIVAAGPLVSELLAHAPQLKVLITTREVLHVYGEYEYPLAPLAVPDAGEQGGADELADYPAVALFLAHAERFKPGLGADPEHAAAIAEICRQLDGLPLAIELAAARTRLLSPRQILARLSNRLQALTGGARDLPLRQQTLRGAIDWSFGLLEPAEQDLFASLAVFSGGWSLEAAEAVCAAHAALDPLDGIGSLLNKSLLRQEEQAGGEARFWMLETIREYAIERLDERTASGALRRQHAEFFARLADQTEVALRGSHQAEWLTRLELEHHNLRAALRFAENTGDAELLVRLSGGLWRFWSMHGHLSEGAEWLAKALARGDLADPAHLAMVRHGAGFLGWQRGDYELARGHFEAGLALRRSLGDTLGSAMLLNNLGHLAILRGDDAAATSLLEEALGYQRTIGDRWGAAFSILNLGNVALRQERYADAAALYDESLAGRRALNDQRGIAGSLSNLGWVRLAERDPGAAAECFAEALRLYLDQGHKIGIAECLTGLASVALQRERPEAAARLWGAAEALGESLGARLCPDIGPIFSRHQAAMAELAGQQAPAAACREGRALPLARVIEEAFAQR
ncbi:MAG TPA: tetratricopeptide repeat protein [Herpetosiphonaceae bacterium]